MADQETNQGSCSSNDFFEVHRYAFLQVLMNRGYVSKDDAMILLEQLGVPDRAVAFDALINATNSLISADGFEIRTTQSLVPPPF